MADERALCYHVEVPALVEELGAAKFVFKSQLGRPGEEPRGERDIEIVIPYPVLQSLEVAIPTILEHLKQLGAEDLYPPKPRPSN